MAFNFRNWLEEAAAQTNPFDSGKTAATVRSARTNPKPVAQTVRATQQQRTPSLIRRVGTGIGLGAVRSVTGLGQGLSGLYDLATPGTGTNRFSKKLDKFAKFTDETAKNEAAPTAAYKGGQFASDALTFATGGGLIKAAAKTPQIARSLEPVSRLTRPISKLRTDAITKVASNGARGRIAATGIRAATSPANVANMALNTGIGLGEESGKGRDISKQDVLLQAAISAGFGIGMPVAGQAAKEGFKAGARGVKSAARKTYETALDRASNRSPIKNLDIRKLSTYEAPASRERVEYYKREILAGRHPAAVVAMRDSSGKLGVEDGKHRLQAYKELGATSIPTRVTTPQQLRAVTQGGYLALPEPAKEMTKGSVEDLGTEVITSPQQQQTAPPIKPPVRTLAAAADDDMSRPPQGTVATMPKGKKTRYASKTVPESEFVSEQVRKDVKAGAPVYDQQTERARYTDSLSRLKAQGDDVFESDVRSRLEVERGKIGSQDVADAQTIAAILDAKGDTASLQKATELYEKLSEHLTAAGQTVQAAAILSRRTPEGLRYWATKQLKEAGVKPTPELQGQLKTLVQAVKKAKNKDRAVYDVTKFVNDNIPSSLGDRIINVWRAGLLTAPTTTGGNLLGNTGEALVRKGFVNPVATAADATMSLFTGKRTQALASPGAATQGFREGVETLPDYLRTGYDPRNLGKKYEQTKDLNYGDGPLGKTLGTYVNGVYRLMGVADAPFNSAASREALSSIANAEALNRGLKGQAKAKFVQDFMADPPEAALGRAAQEGDYATFKNPTLLGSAATGLKSAVRRKSDAGGAVADFILPFTQVPAAIATRLVQRTPIGIASEIVKQVKAVKAGEMFDQRAMAQAIGNGTFGVAAIGAGVSLAKAGQLTFGYPTDAKERKLWEAEGKQPYSVKIGNRWYSLNYLQPFGMLLAIGGQAGNDMKEGKNETEVATKALATAGQAIQEQSFLKGINGILSAISAPERSAQQWMENTTSSVVPNFVRSGARAADEVQRKPGTVVEGVKSGIPGLRGQTPTKDDLFGNPLPAKDNFANQYINPLKPSIDRSDDPVVAEIRRLQEADQGVIPSQVKKDTFGKDTPLTDEQLRDLQGRIGNSVGSAWKLLVADERYSMLSDEDKSKALGRLSKDVLAVEKRKFAAENQVGEYSPDSEGTTPSLGAGAKAILNGNLDVQNYAKTTSDGKGNTVALAGDDRGTALLDSIGTMDKATQEKWQAKPIDRKNRDLYDRSSKILREGMPPLPETNATLKAYADYLEAKKDAKSELKLNDLKKGFVRKAYTSALPDSSKELFGSYTVNEKIAAIKSGSISSDDLAQAVKLDDTMVANGLSSSAKISNRIRRTFGLSDAPKTGGSSSGGSSGGRSTGEYKLYGIANPISNNSRLRQLVKGATLRG